MGKTIVLESFLLHLVKSQRRRNRVTLRNDGLWGKSLLRCPGAGSEPLLSLWGWIEPDSSLISWLPSVWILSNPLSLQVTPSLQGPVLETDKITTLFMLSVSFPVTCVLPNHLAEIQGTFKAPHSQTIFLYRADLLSPENNLLRGESILKLRKLAFQALPPGCVALEESRERSISGLLTVRLTDLL